MIARARGSRLGAVIQAGVKIAVLAALLSVVLFAVGAAVSAAYEQYGSQPERNARSWAALAPGYADSTVCGKCHATEYAPWTVSKHRGVACESCHGPLGAHAAANPPTAVGSTDASDRICTLCHEKVVGRPAGFHALVLESHFPGVSCLQCHNTHTSVAIPPPRVVHSLAQLPECIACHGFTDLYAMPVGHRESPDAVCLGCHVPDQPAR